MRHGSKNKHLSRTSAHRRALLKNLTISLFTHKAIVTTLAKAKALRKHVEPIITKSKGISTQELMMARQRIVFSLLQHEDATKELFTVIAPKIADRAGGYCRIIKLGKRKGDASEMAYIELIDFNEIRNNKPQGAQEGGGTDAKKKKRTRRSSSKFSTPVSVSPVSDKSESVEVKGENASNSSEGSAADKSESVEVKGENASNSSEGSAADKSESVEVKGESASNSSEGSAADKSESVEVKGESASNSSGVAGTSKLEKGKA